MKVSELMIKDLTSVESEDTMRTFVEVLETSETSSVPVTDEEGRLIGIISERDVLAAAMPKYVEMLQNTSFIPNMDQLAKGLNRIAEHPVNRYMRSSVVSIARDADDFQVADLMLRKQLRLLPVVDENQRLVGVVTRVDLFKHVL